MDALVCIHQKDGQQIRKVIYPLFLGDVFVCVGGRCAYPYDTHIHDHSHRHLKLQHLGIVRELPVCLFTGNSLMGLGYPTQPARGRGSAGTEFHNSWATHIFSSSLIYSV